MGNLPTSIRTIRPDLSDWLLHWTRDQGRFKAFDVLKKIASDGFLLPGFSERVRAGTAEAGATIYGPNPAVCFTEQPMLSFLKYTKWRASVGFVAPYAVAVRRNDVFAEGGLPVIYGLEGVAELERSSPSFPPGVNSSARILSPECLSLDQQFRYVAFNPNRTPYPLDWSHEREWRWIKNRLWYRWPGYLIGGTASFHTDRGTSSGEFRFIVAHDHEVPMLEAHLAQVRLQGPPHGLDQVRWDCYLDNLLKTRVFSLESVERESPNDQRYQSIDTHP